MQKPIYVTQPYLPPLEEFIPYLQQIWNKSFATTWVASTWQSLMNTNGGSHA